MFSKSADYYDEIYLAGGKDHAKETARVHNLIQKHMKSTGKHLLDVACGTGSHTGPLGKHYHVEGLDLDPRMIAAARRKFPGVRFHHGNMLTFRLNRNFDAIVCLFSSIGYVRTKSGLRRAIKNMSAHLLPGGVLLVEPWFSPAQWHTGRVTTLQVDKPDVKITRMSWTSRRGNLSRFELHYLVGTPGGIKYMTELHELGLFTRDEYLGAFRAAGLKVVHDPKGLDGRGLFIGMKSPGS